MNDDDDARAAALAARNNAAWCDAVSRAHGLEPRAGDRLWASGRRTPPLYPDAVTLDAQVTEGEVLALVDIAEPWCSVKDSFARLELGAAGFEVLFDARWIHRRPAPAEGAAAWSRVRTAEALARWEAAWGGAEGVFRPELLADPDIAFVFGVDGAADTYGMADAHGMADTHGMDGAAPGSRRPVSGAVLNRAAGAVGVSNVFGAGAWPLVLSAAAGLWPELPLVGYESGEDLTAAARHGFTPVGPLRIWLRSE
ncbi:hypothetical protein [Streptomyces sp. NPDC048603]|uniref:hypothetical protein n=1 Tax=Streptomyces sp. NPDC048603 TaxID=3365577 RepID=UPI00371C31DF